MEKYLGYAEELYEYEGLPTETSFRVLELLPGEGGDPISGLLHVKDWNSSDEYEAVSYCWGDPKRTAPVNVNGKRVMVTVNLRTALAQLRYVR